VVVEADTSERKVVPPEDLVLAIRAHKGAKAAWEGLSYTHQHVEAIEQAKRPQTRTRRIAKCLEMLVGP
jgi:uncharacterized protein YdeI (YjbR/CyaY-like superfamily)